MINLDKELRDALIKRAVKLGWDLEKYIAWVTEGYPKQDKPQTHCERVGKKCND